ncbi:hypothetical protein LWI29_028779 [Acer saccharum]|uniref:Dolichyl-diphosphooligosaccharide--protein glycosyltransferase subunit KCP2 n=1 Tax=Acer saccharum TaxID=4024 RepID=A0AA39RMB4_ACESA|nr:hypothetical protein LWI29_016142 [Acer saccharum]KAK0577162.1 hypothetical protein LWI29_028779 [Acer saccharum]
MFWGGGLGSRRRRSSMFLGREVGPCGGYLTSTVQAGQRMVIESTLEQISGRDRDRAQTDLSLKAMAGTGSSMLYSFLTFTVILSLQEMYRGKLASSELFTILGGFISSLLFLVSLTFIGNFQEASGMKTGWGAVLLAEAIALIAASTVHRVCITTCFLFSAGILYEVNKLSGMMLTKSESKTKRH